MNPDVTQAIEAQHWLVIRSGLAFAWLVLASWLLVKWATYQRNRRNG